MKSTIDYETKGRIFNIQAFSLNDGPGLRTIVFLKGCPLSCKWCSNPESQSPLPQILFNNQNCIDCDDCFSICQNQAITNNNTYKLVRKNCSACGQCVENCYANALTMVGEDKSVKDVMERLEKEDSNFRYSGGGVTLSGGEPLMQENFARELLKACKENSWNTAIETTAYARVDLDKIIPLCDLVLMDFKHIDTNVHKKFTGRGNELILDNAKKISKLAKRLIGRVPVIPGFNADEKSILDIATFVKNLPNVSELHLLPYHRFGLSKYRLMGIEYPLGEEVQTPDEKEMEKYKQIVESVGLKCNVGAE